MLLQFYRQAYLVVTDFSFCRTVFEQPLRNTLYFLVFLGINVAVVQTLSVAIHYGPQFVELLGWAEDNLPAFEVRDGRLQFEGPDPVMRTFPGKQLVTFVFDTTGTYGDPKQLAEPSVLFTADRLHLRYRGYTQTYLWKDWPFHQLRDFGEAVKWAYFPVAFSSILIYGLLAKVFLACVMCSVGMLASESQNIRLPFSQYFTIAVYSLTPAVTIYLAVRVIGMGTWYLTFAYVITAGIYTYFNTQRCVVLEP